METSGETDKIVPYMTAGDLAELCFDEDEEFVIYEYEMPLPINIVEINFLHALVKTMERHGLFLDDKLEIERVFDIRSEAMNLALRWTNQLKCPQKGPDWGKVAR